MKATEFDYTTKTQLSGIRQKLFLDRYSLKNENGEPIEKYPEHMWKRVAEALAAVEKTSLLDVGTVVFLGIKGVATAPKVLYINVGLQTLSGGKIFDFSWDRYGYDDDQLLCSSKS